MASIPTRSQPTLAAVPPLSSIADARILVRNADQPQGERQEFPELADLIMAAHGSV